MPTNILKKSPLLSIEKNYSSGVSVEFSNYLHQPSVDIDSYHNMTSPSSQTR
ncbi:hypothetical protein DPMN_102351 [Dreissena polymorpha]|uniref:Uncharacterized protein n=1 Tax=Dreissena polymorpha TaxID=45954 RepID=A0A9D4LKH0_DREPO|nr:hypothetical protein DPMN_102351 [Dreissena polymorpha]